MSQSTIKSFDPVSGKHLDNAFQINTLDDLESKIESAQWAYLVYRNTSGEERATFLETIADEIESDLTEIVATATLETGLPAARIQGETGRTVGQLRLFASITREGSWVEGSIDTALPNRQPLPRVDIRKYLIPIGPVGIFGAANYPLAFSTAGGDTASALAAGNPVVVKANNSHLGTHDLICKAIARAIENCNLPEGVFGAIVDSGFELGRALVQHPGIKAVGFTGSYSGGRALFDLVSQRKDPIPFYGEMGSINPIVLFDSAIANASTSKQLINAIILGVGQFCTNPGLLLAIDSEAIAAFCNQLAIEATAALGGVMLHQGIYESYQKATTALGKGVEMSVLGEGTKGEGAFGVSSYILKTTGEAFLSNSQLSQEVFGPYSLLVICKDEEELATLMMELEGQLTISFMGTEAELEAADHLIAIAQEKAGRVIFNGVPTGVEVCHAMVHGGPFPATTQPNSTSVGAEAIKRFSRPVCFQNAPQSILPLALQDENPLNIFRKINGTLTKQRL